MGLCARPQETYLAAPSRLAAPCIREPLVPEPPPLPVGGFGHAAVKGASLVENRDEVAEVGVAGRRVEAAVPAHELLERFKKSQAPARVGLTADAPAADVDVDVDVHRRGVSQHRLVKCVGMTGAARHG